MSRFLNHAEKNKHLLCYLSSRPRGLTDKASDFESEDCEFESRPGRYFLSCLIDTSQST